MSESDKEISWDIPTTDKEIEQLVDSWVWNESIFGIYDFLKDESCSFQKKVLKQCLKTFNEGRSFDSFLDLASHLEHECLVTQAQTAQKKSDCKD